MSKSTKMFVVGLAVGVVGYHLYAQGMGGKQH